MKIKGYLEKKEGEIIGIASTEAVDRDGDIIKQDGWDISNFLKNPVLMLFHNYQEFPIGKVTELKIENGKMIFKAVFSEATEKAKEAYGLVKEGILSAFSVGFIPRDFDDNNNNIITRAELLEISLVPVPANPEAIVLAKNYKEESEIAKYIVKNFENEINSDTTTKVVKDNKVGKDSGKNASEIDLKLIQLTVGHLQGLCRELKMKGGVKK